MSDTNVITLFPRADAPVQRFPTDSPPPYPRASFGRLPVGYWSRDLKEGMEAAGEDDRAQQENFKRIARELRAAKGEHVCASLKRDLAAKITGAAMLLETLAEEAKACGLTSTLIALREHAGLLEKESALVACALPDGGDAA